jgi:hypothetical protein
MRVRLPSFRPRALVACVPAVALTVMASAGAASASHTPANSRAGLRTALEHLLIGWHPANHAVGVREIGGTGLKQVVSGNWSGYADTKTSSTYSSVSGQWTEPKITGCKASTESLAVFWVGIDGYGDKTVEQDGTAAICPGDGSTTPFYASWWEVFPKPLTLVGESVAPGDKISASVVRKGTKYTFKVTDSTHSANSLTKSASCAAANCKDHSAEWIAETPEFSNGTLSKLPDFGTWTVTNTAVKAGSKSGTIKTFPDSEIFLEDASDKVLAQPGALNSAGNSFKDVWKASS